MGNSVLFRSRTNDSGRSCTVLAVDVGGTKTNLALFRHENGRSVLIREKTSVTKDFPAASHCLKDFLGDDLPDRICLGVAGPVQDGKVLLTNVSWEIDAHRLSESLNNIPVFLEVLAKINPVTYAVAPIRHVALGDQLMTVSGEDTVVDVTLFGHVLSTPESLAIVIAFGLLMLSIAIRSFQARN